MAAKTISVSADDSTYYVLPGSTGDAQNQASSIDDTIFGQSYKSIQPGLVGWDVSGQAFYKGFAGYKAKILKTGSSTAMTDEAMTQVGSSKTYRVTAATKRVVNPAVAIVIEDHSGGGGTPADVTAQVESYNYLFGEITFLNAFTPTGAVQITGEYYPTSTLGKANSYTLTQTAQAIDKTDFGTAQGNSGHRVFQQGLRTVQLDLEGFYDVTSAFRVALDARNNIIVEINPDGSGKSLARGFFQVTSQGQSGQVGALEDEKVSMMLNVPSSSYIPFGWHHESDTTLHSSVRAVLDAWLANGAIFVKYQYDGTNGIKGASIVTEATMKGGLDAMNEFTCKFQGTGQLTTVGTG